MPRATTSPTPNGRSTMPARGPRSGSAGGRVRVTRPKAGVPIDAKSLAKMDINSVWVEYRSGGEVVIRDFLIRRYHHIVRSIADRIRSRLPSAVDGYDLVSSGVFGLIDAINNFDPGKGVKFETFCGKRIRGAIFDNIRQMDYASRLARRSSAVSLLIAREDCRRSPRSNSSCATRSWVVTRSTSALARATSALNGRWSMTKRTSPTLTRWPSLN